MKTLLASTALLATQILNAATPINGWYASVFGGFAYLPDNVSKTRYGLTFNDANYEGGYDVGGNFGFKSTPLRYEAEITYLRANIDHFRINNTLAPNPSGFANGAFAMANIYYDLPGFFASCIEPYLGAGLGYGRVEAELKSNNAIVFNRFSESSNALTYQAMTGLTYNFSENYAASLGYRYLATERVGELGKIFQVHMANVGVTYRFDEVRYK